VTLELLDIENTEMTAAEVRLELACALYAHGKITAVTSSHLASVDVIGFQAAPRNEGLTATIPLRIFTMTWMR